MTTKIERRIKIKYRVRNKISGTAERPRMSVFRSNKQIYVQLINSPTFAACSFFGSFSVIPKEEAAAKVLPPKSSINNCWVKFALRYVLSVSPNRIKVKVLSLLVKKFVESLVNLPALSNLHKIRML